MNLVSHSINKKIPIIKLTYKILTPIQISIIKLTFKIITPIQITNEALIQFHIKKKLTFKIITLIQITNEALIQFLIQKKLNKPCLSKRLQFVKF